MRHAEHVNIQKLLFHKKDFGQKTYEDIVCKITAFSKCL